MAHTPFVWRLKAALNLGLCVRKCNRPPTPRAGLICLERSYPATNITFFGMESVAHKEATYMIIEAKPRHTIRNKRCDQVQLSHAGILPAANHRKRANTLFIKTRRNKIFRQARARANKISFLYNTPNSAITLIHEESEVDNAKPACANGHTKIQLKTTFAPSANIEIITGVRISCLA